MVPTSGECCRHGQRQPRWQCLLGKGSITPYYSENPRATRREEAFHPRTASLRNKVCPGLQCGLSFRKELAVIHTDSRGDERSLGVTEGP